MVVDPVLAFVKAFRLRGSTANLKRTALSKFDDGLMSKAKRALWDSACAEALTEAGLAFQARQGSKKRSQATADLEDILTAFDKLDESDSIPEIFCEATDLVNLPPIVVDACTELVQNNGACLETIQEKLDGLSKEMTNLVSKLSESASSGFSHSHVSSGTPLQSGAAVSHVRGEGASRSVFSMPSNFHNKADVERRENLMIFGVQETQSMTDTMSAVQNMLEFLVGRPTPVKDLYRVGRRKKEGSEATPVRPRPIVLKLISPWDRRLVFNNRFNLKEYSVKGIFVHEDLSPEAQQQRKERYESRKGLPTSK